MPVASLLPPNASPLERAAEQATARIGTVPVDIDKLWRPGACPTPLLPWLAWALSVDEWQPTWTEAQQRETIRRSYEVHRIKGTLGAVKTALASVDYETEIIEWFQEAPAAAPYTFRAAVDITGKGITEEIQDEIIRLIEASKNVRSHMTSIRFRGSVSGDVYAAAWALSAETTTVYPYSVTDVEVSGQAPYFGAGLFAYETVTVNAPPRGDLAFNTPHPSGHLVTVGLL
jgi:phage tail P2-like protein